MNNKYDLCMNNNTFYVLRILFFYFIQLIFITAVFSQQQTIKITKGVTVNKPMIIYSPEYQKEYILTHYWEDINADSLNRSNELINNLFVDFVHLLYQVPQKTAIISLKKMVNLYFLDELILNKILKLSEKNFFDPNSLFRNEEFYIPIIETAISVNSLTYNQKRYFTDQLVLMNKNRINTFASDFNFALANGTVLNLYSIKSKYLILLFSNPQCHTCEVTIDQFFHSEIISKLLKINKNNFSLLQILNIYTDNDLKVWFNYERSYPRLWINGYDKDFEINKKGLYDLKAMPTLYLLNEEKKVILKDISLLEIENYLNTIKDSI